MNHKNISSLVCYIVLYMLDINIIYIRMYVRMDMYYDCIDTYILYI